MKGVLSVYIGSERSPRNQATRELGWLGAAIILHVALIFLPLGSWKLSQQGPTRTDIPLSIELSKFSLAKPTPAEEAIQPNTAAGIEAKAEPAPASAPLVRQTANPSEENKPLSERVQEPAEVAVQTPEPIINSTILRRAAEQADYAKTEEKPRRQLGEQPDYQMPGNWKSGAGAPYLAGFENTFNGMTVPSEVEIVDRWQAADGSHRVVLNLPNGDTVCGRAEAYNPMTPLVEPIMLFGSCGGGGKRTFTMSQREKLELPQ